MGVDERPALNVAVLEHLDFFLYVIEDPLELLRITIFFNIAPDLQVRFVEIGQRNWQLFPFRHLPVQSGEEYVLFNGVRALRASAKSLARVSVQQCDNQILAVL